MQLYRGLRLETATSIESDAAPNYIGVELFQGHQVIPFASYGSWAASDCIRMRRFDLAGDVRSRASAPSATTLALFCSEFGSVCSARCSSIVEYTS